MKHVALLVNIVEHSQRDCPNGMYDYSAYASFLLVGHYLPVALHTSLLNIVMELPTSQEIEDIFAELTRLFDLPESEWKLMGKENEVTVHSMKYKKYPMHVAKITSILKFGAEDVLQELFDEVTRPIWDTMFPSASRIMQEGDAKVMHIKMAPLGIISARDVVLFNITRPDGAGGFLSILQSFPTSEKGCPTQKDFVRAEIILGGHKLESIEIDGAPATKLTNLNLVDLKGWLPHVNLKIVFMKGAEGIHGLKDYLTKKHAAK